MALLQQKSVIASTSSWPKPSFTSVLRNCESCGALVTPVHPELGENTLDLRRMGMEPDASVRERGRDIPATVSSTTERLRPSVLARVLHAKRHRDDEQEECASVRRGIGCMSLFRGRLLKYFPSQPAACVSMCVCVCARVHNSAMYNNNTKTLVQYEATKGVDVARAQLSPRRRHHHRHHHHRHRHHYHHLLHHRRHHRPDHHHHHHHQTHRGQDQQY